MFDCLYEITGTCHAPNKVIRSLNIGINERLCNIFNNDWLAQLGASKHSVKLIFSDAGNMGLSQPSTETKMSAYKRLCIRCHWQLLILNAATTNQYLTSSCYKTFNSIAQPGQGVWFIQWFMVCLHVTRLPFADQTFYRNVSEIRMQYATLYCTINIFIRSVMRFHNRSASSRSDILQLLKTWGFTNKKSKQL